MSHPESGGSLEEIVAKHLAGNEISLPLFDGTSAKLQKAVSGGDFDVDEIAGLILSDPSLTGELLRLANSSFFGGIEKVLTVKDAIMRMGVKQVADLVILSGQRRHYRLKDPKLHEFVQRLWRHAVGCAIGAEWLAKKLHFDEIRDEAFMAGLLHDVGKLLLLRVIDDLRSEGKLPFDPSETLIQQVLDGLHTTQGYALMQRWNIPEAYAEIVRDHEASEADERNLLLQVVRLVDCACNKEGIGMRGKEDIDLAARAEVAILRVSPIVLAELEIRLEDAMELASPA